METSSVSALAGVLPNGVQAIQRIGNLRYQTRGLARGSRDGSAFPSRWNLEQRILPTDYVEAKIHNLELAAARVQDVTVPSGGIFSFWHMVGRPTQARGFQPGRYLLGGRLQADYGGGLSQLSSIPPPGYLQRG